MKCIKVLPESVHSSMRSGIILFDLARVVEELVFNSLDAGATKVTVAVGVGTSYIKVTDNGCGITRDGLVLLGERYATSKFEQLADMNTVLESFGFRGEALSSISDVSLLEVITKARGMPNGYRKVIKGCKCLYLGIDDDRQDVGTTVVVHDLFYNQPVRRRHLQSSPKKVLHSVKECILRIALVHLGTCFKVIDTESGDELLCMYPSSSPLPLLMSGFGTEVSSSLHKLDASNGELKLSGYISGPFETFSTKAFQYLYINSRYISKGPIHKLLNQLSTLHSCSDLLTADIRSQCGKRSRSQASYPTYILNLSCPRAHYDLSFEPTKTCVAFKDWDRVLAFIKKAVSCFWSQENSFGQGTDMSEEDDIWNGVGTSSTRDDLLNNYALPKKRCMTQSHQASIGLSSPQLKLLREEPKQMLLQSNSRHSHNRSQINAVQFEDHGSGIDFAYITDKYEVPIPDESGNHLGVLNGYISSEDLYLENKWSREPCSEQMDHLSDAKWNPNPLHTDCSTSNRLVETEPCADSFHFVDDGEKVDEDLMKPFLRGCSSSTGSLPDVGITRCDNQSRFQIDGFKKWLYTDDRVDVIHSAEPWKDEAETVWSPPRINTSCNLDTDSSFLSKGSLDSLSVGGECFTEDNSHWSDPVPSNLCSKPSHRSSKFDWSVSALGSPCDDKMHVEPLADDVFERRIKHDRDDGFDFSTDEVENDIFNFDTMRYRSSQEDYSFEGHTGCKKKIRNSHNDIFFPEWSDFLDGTEGMHSESSGKHETCIPASLSRHMSSLCYANVGKNKSAESRFQDKKPRRSCSAPPFYRGRKKFVALNSSITVKSRKSHYETLQKSPGLEEASHVNHKEKSSGVDHFPLEEGLANDSQSKARYDTKKIIDKTEISNYEIEMAECLDLHNTDSDFTSKENQSALDFGVKWRNGCPWTASIERPNDLTNQDSILDISSGILHLSGDSLLPKSINKKCLEDSRVLQQVDKKFIPVVAGGILAIIDQHAADERIRLEDLRRKVLSGEMKTVAYLDAEQELVLPEIGYQLLHNYSEQIQKWGWICNFHTQSSASFKKNLNFLHNQPSIATLIAVPCILGVNLTDADLLEFLQQLADTDGSSVIPPAVLRVLNFKACRGAIMFGDALFPSECSLIVEELKQTQLCFQCAHGRPTTAPLVNLAVLHKQIAKLGNWSHGSPGSWHGLRRHRPTLERASQRLNSYGGQC